MRLKNLAHLKYSADNRYDIGSPIPYFTNSQHRFMHKAGFRAITALVIAFATIMIVGSGLEGAKADTITIIPPKFEIFGNPGDVISEKLKVRNDTPVDITYEVRVDDFVAQGDQGGINLIEDPASAKNTYSLANWVTFEPRKFTVQANKEGTINLNVRIPRNAEPGGHYASVVIKREGGEVTGGASVQTQLNSLVLLRVSGNVTEKLEIDTFKSENQFYQYGPIGLMLRTTNKGNVHVAPTGTLVVKNMLGKKVKEIPLTQANVLPGASRSVKTTWDTRNLVGRYTVDLIGTYGQQAQAITASSSFIVFPIYLMWLVVGVIALIFLLITQRKKVKRFINRLTRD